MVALDLDRGPCSHELSYFPEGPEAFPLMLCSKAVQIVPQKFCICFFLVVCPSLIP